MESQLSLSASMRSAIRWAGPCNCSIVQLAAYPSVTSLGGAGFTSRLVSAFGSISSRSLSTPLDGDAEVPFHVPHRAADSVKLPPFGRLVRAGSGVGFHLENVDRGLAETGSSESGRLAGVTPTQRWFEVRGGSLA